MLNRRGRDRFVPLIVPLCIKIYVDMVKGEWGLSVGLVLDWMLMILGNLGWGWIEGKCKKFLVGKSFIRQSAAGRLKSKNICKIAPYPPCFKDLIFSM